MRVCPRCSMETELEICPDDGSTTFAVQKGQETYTPGTLIAGRYRVDAVLGVGGFGAVYRCTQLAMNQTIAVKVLRNEHLSSVEHVKRFTREAQAVSRLKHPNTIHTFDFGTHTDGALYLAMEYLEGETLANRLDTNGIVYWETMVRIATQICHSLTEAHALGLVHRDLKPENIMLMPVAGDPNFVKVLDFGIAKMQKDPAKPGEASLTETGMIMGTPTYMSPEQAKGDPIDARSDVYSLGIMMYEAMTGHPPFHDETAMKVLVAHIKDPPQAFPRTGMSDEPPPDIEKVVMQCLEKDPSRRPQSTTQLVDRLVTAARRARDMASFAPPVGEHQTDMLNMGDMPTISIAGVRPSAYNLRAESPAPAPESAVVPPAPPVSKRPMYIAGGAFISVAVGAVVALVLAANEAKQQPSADAESSAPAAVATGRPGPAAAIAPVVPAAPAADAQGRPPAAVAAVAAAPAAVAATDAAAKAPTVEPAAPAVAVRQAEPEVHADPAASPREAKAADKANPLRSGEAKSAAARAAEAKAAEAKAAEAKAAEAKAAEAKAAEAKAALAKAAETKPPDRGSGGPDAHDSGKKGPGHDDFRLDDEK